MISKESKQSVQKAWKEFLKARQRLAEARMRLVEELFAANQIGGASYEELGSIMKVSRQRVGQYLKGVK